MRTLLPAVLPCCALPHAPRSHNCSPTRCCNRKRDAETAPSGPHPLITGSIDSGDFLVRGFNSNERTAFRKVFGRFGLLDEDWAVVAKAAHQKSSGLRQKSKMELVHYGSLFLAHLDEMVRVNAETKTQLEVFTEGIPVEGLDPNELLKRIGSTRVSSRRIRYSQDMLCGPH